MSLLAMRSLALDPGPNCHSKVGPDAKSLKITAAGQLGQ